MEQQIARCVAVDGREIAYAVVGSGPALVWPAWWISHLERDWQNPAFRGFMERLAERHTVVRYDRPGLGLSFGPRDSFTLEEETDYLATVVDAAGIDHMALVGMACGVPPALRFAVRFPERVDRVVAYGGYLRGRDIASESTRKALVALVEANWGIGSETISRLFAPQAELSESEEFARYQQATATPATAAALLELTYAMDTTDVVPLVSTPTLVLHRSDDHAIPLACGEQLARALPRAELMILDGRNHVPWVGDAASVLDAVEEFLTGVAAGPEPTRETVTVMFTDIVGSTKLLAELGDRRWRSRLDEHDALLRRQVDRFDGRVVNFLGDGALAVFSRASQALRCAKALQQELAGAGLSLRVGVHVGEVEVRERSVDGLAVHVAARIQAVAEPGDVLVSSTVRDVAAGSGLRFEDRGEHDLKGLPTPVHLLTLC